MNDPTPSLHELAGGDVLVWLDPTGGICIKTVEPHGDPVELSDQEAIELARLLMQLVAEQG